MEARIHLIPFNFNLCLYTFHIFHRAARMHLLRFAARCTSEVKLETYTNIIMYTYYIYH